MTQFKITLPANEIMELDALIGRFMGYTTKFVADTSSSPREPSFYFYIKDGVKTPDVFFSQTWTGLMPVLEQIEKTGAIVEIWMALARGVRICRPNKKNEKVLNIVYESDDLGDAAYRAAADYIKWFNEYQAKCEQEKTETNA